MGSVNFAPAPAGLCREGSDYTAVTPQLFKPDAVPASSSQHYPGAACSGYLALIAARCHVSAPGNAVVMEPGGITHVA